MSRSNHYSLAAPTSLLLDDDQIIERVFSHIDNKTTDLGDQVWKEPDIKKVTIWIQKKVLIVENRDGAIYQT